MRLREWLRDRAPALHADLERCWQLAWDTWLPSLPVSKGSFNSYPHLRNVELHLDAILCGDDPALPRTDLLLDLSAAEVYLLLAAVLFHDIGRIYHGDETVTHPHGELTRELLDCRGRNYYAVLGLSSVEVARSLGRICCFHDCTDEERKQLRSHKLGDTEIAPHGRVREAQLAALLAFADRLDSSYTRVTPEFTWRGCSEPLKAAFRSVVRGVAVDPCAQMVRLSLTSADNSNIDLHKAAVLMPANVEPFDKRVTEAALRTFRESNWNDLLAASHRRKGLFYKSRPPRTSCYPRAVPWPTSTRPTLNLCLGLRQFDDLYRLMVHGAVTCEPRQSAKVGLPPEAVLAILMRDVRSNSDALSGFASMLSVLGLHVRAWLIEYEGRLYTWQGEETFEPVLSKEFLKRTARSMWDLSRKVFGCAHFTHEVLAGDLREPDVDKVRMAAKRLAILTRGLATPGRQSDAWNALWSSNSEWKWNVTLQRSTDALACKFTPISNVINDINSLTEAHQ